jgi:hypothetical protein
MRLFREIGLIFCSENSCILVPSWASGSYLQELNLRHVEKCRFWHDTNTDPWLCFFSVSYLTTASQYRDVALDGRVVGEWWIEKVLEESGHSLEILSLNFLEGLRKTTNTTIRIGDVWPRFEPSTSQMQVWSIALNQPVQYDCVVMVFLCIGDALDMTGNIFLCSIPYLDLQRPAFATHLTEICMCRRIRSKGSFLKYYSI